MSSGFVHLHVHDQYSLLDGLGSAEQYSKYAKEVGMDLLASTNHGNVDGCLKFQQACDAEGVGPIFGAELYVVKDKTVEDKDERRLHITVLVAREEGWKNLLQLITVSNLKGFYKRPRVDPASILEFSSGLFWMTACSSSVLISEWGQKLMEDLVKKVGPEMVLAEVMPHDSGDQKAVNKLALDFANDFPGVGVVATNDCHYVKKEDDELQEVLLAIQTGAKWKDPKRWKFNIRGLHLKTRAEMEEAFVEQGQLSSKDAKEALDLTCEIAEECRSGFPAIPKREVELPRVVVIGDKTDDEAMRSIIEEGFKNLIVKTLPRVNHRGQNIPLETYRKRVEEEFETICQLGFQRYFLIVWELIHWCRLNGIMTGPGRGSVGGSLVAYLMRITGVDPLQHGLVFTRFISPARIDLPDIDMDFEDRKRHLVRRHLEDLYGVENVAGVSTFGTLKGKAAIRDIGRVFDIPYGDIDSAAKSIVTRSMGDDRADYTIADAFETFEDGKRFKKKHPKVADLAIRIEGQIRGAGQHAAGICVSAESLQEGVRCSLVKRSGEIIANWDKHDVEYFGLMKLDVLGLSALSVLSDARDMIMENHGVSVNFETLKLDDPKVFEEASQGHTVGAFQLSSFGLQRYCAELGISRFSDIVDATALWRPGTLRSGMAEEFKKRKLGLSKWELIHPSMENLTKDTHGIILYQEQVMQMAYDLAGMTWKNCDLIRKVISKSQGDSLFATYKTMFVKGCSDKKTLDEKSAGQVWDDLASFGSYGFNKSHSVEYSMITYWDMWLKVYYPGEFMAASLTHCKGDNKDELVREARRLKLKIVPPKISTSEPERWIAKGDRLLVPLREIKGIGEKACEKIKSLSVKKTPGKGFFPGLEVQEQLPKNIVALLTKVRAFEDDKLEFTDEETEAMSELFQFDLSQDPMREVRGIETLVKPFLVSMKSVADSKIGATKYLVMGRIENLRYSYRKQVTEAKKGSKSYGGVYGYLRDESGIQMITFSTELYSSRKDDIEHCHENYVIAEVEKGKNDMLYCGQIWLQNDLTSADFLDMNVDLLTKSKTPMKTSFDSGVASCRECPLVEKCNKPVRRREGLWSVLVISEAPSPEADKSGDMCDGKVEEYLIGELKRMKVRPEWLNFTSVVKCNVPKGSTLGVKDIRRCSGLWLDKEVEELKPAVILLLGNTPLLWATGLDSGISKLNGTTLWNPKLNAWVSYCVSPASALYSAENRPTFLTGLKGFVDTLEVIGADLGTPMTVQKETGGKSKGVMAKDKALSRFDSSIPGQLARIRFAMRQLYYARSEPVTTDDAHAWVERNGIELPEKSFAAVFGKPNWKSVGHTVSSRDERHAGHLLKWVPIDG